MENRPEYENRCMISEEVNHWLQNTGMGIRIEETRGYYDDGSIIYGLYFQNSEDAMMFRLRWLDS